MNFSQDTINTIENLIYRNKVKRIYIYYVVILSIITIFALLPIIKVDISSQSRGIIRSRTENVPITTIVSGRIVSLSIRNNYMVEKGDTLIKISKENLESDKHTQDVLSRSVVLLLRDVSNLLQNNVSSLSTSVAREELAKFQSGKSELQSKEKQLLL